MIVCVLLMKLNDDDENFVLSVKVCVFMCVLNFCDDDFMIVCDEV